MYGEMLSMIYNTTMATLVYKYIHTCANVCVPCDRYNIFFDSMRILLVQ